jgi:hypothetical protein
VESLVWRHHRYEEVVLAESHLIHHFGFLAVARLQKKHAKGARMLRPDERQGLGSATVGKSEAGQHPCNGGAVDWRLT